DAPLFFSAGVTGGQPWEPKNYDSRYDGPMTMRTGLNKSKNMISIRLLQAVGPKQGQEWVTRFGFDAAKHPAYLTMALGAGAVTPLQLAAGYSVFANGGHRVNPWLIARVTDHKGRILSEFTPPPVQELPQAIDARNAFIMDSLLQDVARVGTAARAQSTLKRPDLYGKTGTTNDSVDAWFAGFQPTLAAVSWIGYDTPRNLGSRETGGGLSLPIWIGFMQHALKGVPVAEMPVPPGVVNMGGEWYYEENARNGGVSSLGMDSASTAGAAGATPPPATEERNRILDLFRN
ncbi:penicillin-binding transpeptidase domain-containing protein, partial [Delftia acidovorans]